MVQCIRMRDGATEAGEGKDVFHGEQRRTVLGCGAICVSRFGGRIVASCQVAEGIIGVDMFPCLSGTGTVTVTDRLTGTGPVPVDRTRRVGL